MSIIGLGIVQPYLNTLTDLNKKLDIIITGINSFDITSIHDMQTFTSDFYRVRNDITKEINKLQKIDVPAITLTAQAAGAAHSASTMAQALKLATDIGNEIVSAVKCFQLIASIIVKLLAIPLTIVFKIVELSLHAIMMAEKDALKFLNELKHSILEQIKEIKQEMLDWVRYQQGILVVQGIITNMKSELAIIGAPNSTSNPTIFNTAAIAYNNNLGTLLEIEEHAIYGDINVNIYTEQEFNTLLFKLELIPTI